MTTAAIGPPRPSTAIGDRLFGVACRTSGWAILALAAALVVVLTWRAFPALSRADELGIFRSARWAPDGVRPEFGVWSFVYGTLVTSAIALALALPLGVASATYLSQIASGRVRRVGSFLVDLLAAIPSVIYGFWGLVFLAPGLQWVFDMAGAAVNTLGRWCGAAGPVLDVPNTGGTGLLAAGLALAIMIVPFVTASSFEALRAVPASQRDAALALGATRWQMIRSTVLPVARPGLLAAGFLALGRALGETMAVTMLIGNQAHIGLPPFASGDSVASVLAKQFNSADSELHRSALVALALLLLAVTVLVNVCARYLVGRAGEGGRFANWMRLTRPARPSTAAANGGLRRTARRDRIMTGVMFTALVVTVIPLFLILGDIAIRGARAVDWTFFAGLPKGPSRPGGGLGHALVGSGILVALATVFAVPLGLTTAMLLAEFHASRLATAVRFVVDLLGGVPTIVVGIFAYWVLVPTLGTFSAWAGAFALGVIMLPTVIRAGTESLRAVPPPLRDASLALGASRSQTAIRVTLPAALPGMATGACLAVGRIAGETAPLLVTAFGCNFWPTSLNEPLPFLPQYIYVYSASGDPEWERLAWAAALVLVGVVLVVNVGSRVLMGRRVTAASAARD